MSEKIRFLDIGTLLRAYMIDINRTTLLGWDEEDPTCQTPLCDKVNCGSDGFCVAPNKCVCTQLSTQVKKLFLCRSSDEEYHKDRSVP